MFWCTLRLDLTACSGAVSLIVLEPCPFIVEPFDELRDTPEKWCKPSVKEFVGSEITLTLSDNEPPKDSDGDFTGSGWVAEDVGSYVRINSGLVRIKSVTSAQKAVGTIRTDLSATQAASPGAWTREDTVWNDELGYPGAVTLYQQRLVLAGSPRYPQTIWFSETGVYLSFELGTDDDKAISFTLSSDQLNPIVHLAQMNTLIALTYGGEFTITAGNDSAITPTNISVKIPALTAATIFAPFVLVPKSCSFNAPTGSFTPWRMTLTAMSHMQLMTCRCWLNI